MRGIRLDMAASESFIRLVAGLSITVAVIVGLLAMHSMNTTQHAHDSSHSVVADAHAAVSSPDVEGISVATADACNCVPHDTQPMHSPLMQACALSLLVTLLILLPNALSRIASHSVARRVTKFVRFVILSSPRAPSLVALSISRT